MHDRILSFGCQQIAALWFKISMSIEAKMLQSESPANTHLILKSWLHPQPLLSSCPSLTLPRHYHIRNPAGDNYCWITTNVFIVTSVGEASTILMLLFLFANLEIHSSNHGSVFDSTQGLFPSVWVRSQYWTPQPCSLGWWKMPGSSKRLSSVRQGMPKNLTLVWRVLSKITTDQKSDSIHCYLYSI